MLNQQLKLVLPQNKRSRNDCSPLVLVVDDNEDNILYACGSLELFNCQHIVANSGQAAIDLARKEMPDLILMDIVMPKFDGISLTRMLKQSLLTSHIPVIAVTGLAMPHHKEQILNSGFDDYLVKPFTIEALETKLRGFLWLSG